MIEVTEQAAKELRSLLKDSKAGPRHAVRLASDNRGGLTMTICEPKDGDTIITAGDLPVLIVADSVVKALDGLIFDYATREVDGNPHHGFQFRRPDTAA